MTEESLAAACGLVETAEMAAMRHDVLRLAQAGTETGSEAITEALGRYQQLGEEAVDKSYDDHARAKAQIGLILLTASLRRDIARIDPSCAGAWIDDLADAQLYAENLREITLANNIAELLAAGIS